MSAYKNYLNMTMTQLSTILNNTSQSDTKYNSKDNILDSIKRILIDYNDAVEESDQVRIVDNRVK